jgi:DNA-binding NarL/FixJ family response regulator
MSNENNFTAMINVYVLDDHPIVAEALEHAAAKSGRICVAGFFRTVEDGRKALERRLPDVLVLDVDIPPDGNGIDFCREVHGKYPDLKIVMITGFCEYSTIKRAMNNGASGYVAKSSGTQQMIEGIEAVMEDREYYCSEIRQVMRKNMDRIEVPELTRTEKGVVRYLAEGKKHREIAKEMFLSEYTVPSVVKTLIDKLEVNNAVELVDKCRKEKLI